QVQRRREEVVQDAVDPQAHGEAALERLDVDVARAGPHGLVEDRVHQPDRGRVLARLEEIGRLAGLVERCRVELEPGPERAAVLRRRPRRRVVGAADRLAQDLGRYHHRVDAGAVEETQVVERREGARVGHRDLEALQLARQREHQVPPGILHRERSQQLARRQPGRRGRERQPERCGGLARATHPPGPPRGAHEGPRSTGLRRRRGGIWARSCSELSAICSSVAMTWGVRKTSRLVFTRRFSSRLKRLPSTGTSFRNRTPRSSCRTVSPRRPPITTVWRSCAPTTVLAERIVVVGPTTFGSPTAGFGMGSMSETSSNSDRWTKSSAVMRGLRRSVMPTSCRSIVVKRFERFEELVARLAMKGMLRPTTISASSLSVVTMFGAESTSTSLSVSRAVSSSV